MEDRWPSESLETETAVRFQTPLQDLARFSWTLLASLPLAGALPWLAAAVVRRRWWCAGRAFLMVLGPTLGLLMTAVVSEFLAGRAVTGQGEEFDLATDLDLEIMLLGVIWSAQWVSAAMAAWRLWPELARSEPVAATTGRSCWAIWVLWFSLGWLGVHRFYCGRWISGLIYVFTLGLGGVGWAFDVYYFDVLARDLARWPVAPATPTRVAPWAAELRYRRLEFLLRLAYFCLAPFFFVHFCVYFGHFELLAVMILVVIACGFLGDLEQVIARMSFLERIPLTRPAVFFFRELYAYYLEHRPQPFLFYLFQILLGPFLVWFSPQLRRELWLFGKFLLTIFALLAVQQLQSVGTTYRYMQASSVAWWIGLHLLLTGVMTWQFLIPIITTSFTMKLSGQQRGLKVLSLIVLALTLPVGAVSLYVVSHATTPTALSWRMLESRLAHERFRNDLSAASELFLKHYQPYSPAPVAPDNEARHSELTRRFQLHLKGLVPENEARAFQVVTYSEHASPDDLWLGVVVCRRHEDLHRARTLFLLTSDGRFIAEWEGMTPAMRRRFERMASVDPAELAEEHRVAVHSATVDERLYREASRWLLQIAEREGERFMPWMAAAAPPDAPAVAESDAAAVRFRPQVTQQFRMLLERLGLEDVERFRVFELTANDAVWLGVRNQRHALLVVSSMGDSLSRWDQKLYDPQSESAQKFRRLDEQSIPPPPGSGQFDPNLAKDLIRQYAHEYLAYAARVRWSELGRGLGAQPVMTAEFQDMLRDLLPAQQRTQMQVFAWSSAATSQSSEPLLTDVEETPPWLGVIYDGQPLFVRTAAGDFFVRGAANLTADAQQAFSELTRFSGKNAAVASEPQPVQVERR